MTYALYKRRTFSLIIGIALFAGLHIGTTEADAAEFKMRIAGAPPAGDIRYEALDYLVAELSKATNGRIEVEAFKGTLGGEREILERLTLGTIEAYIGSTGPLQSLTGEALASLYEVPYLFKDWDHLYRVANSDIGKKLHEKLANRGIRVLDYVSMGTRAVYTRKNPIAEPQDLSGLKVRVMENPIYIKLYKELGATPVPMSWTEIYTALQTGVLDGVDGSLSSGLASKHTESAKYVTFLGNHVVIASIISVSESWWQSLPGDLRSTIASVAHDAAILEHKKNEEYQARLMEEWRRSGVEFSDTDRTGFVEIAETKVYPLVYEKIDKDLIDRVRALEK